VRDTNLGRTDGQTTGRLYAPLKFFGEHKNTKLNTADMVVTVYREKLSQYPISHTMPRPPELFFTLRNTSTSVQLIIQNMFFFYEYFTNHGDLL
jgi:hypothetical protein